MDQRISSLDLNFLAVDGAHTPQTIGGLFELDGLASRVLVLERLKSLLPDFPRLRFYLDLQTECWREDPLFDLERHVSEVSGVSDSTIAFAEALSHPLPIDRPPWQLKILHSADLKRSGLLFTFSHHFTDGIGALAFIFTLFDEDSASSGRHEIKRTKIFDRLPRKTTTLKLLPRLTRLARDFFSKRDDSPLVGVNSSHREIFHCEIPVERVKAKRLDIGCASNDMILAAFCSALRSYCEQVTNSGTFENVRVIIPFNRRTFDQLCSFSNYLAGMAVNLPLNEPTIELMARRIGASLTTAKFSGEYGAYQLLALFNSVLPSSLRRKVARAAARRTSLICTNMPGPRTPLYIGGAELAACYGSAALMPGHGLAVSFISMGDKLCCSVLTDPTIISNGRLIIDEFQRIFTSDMHYGATRTGNSDTV